ncbi:hypothetical protein LCGC14_2027100 [marine sediment metagenome]|uniref:Uncharacterized protein n=1 Tax=marine sediment metagenome TaxID=412755 RepID=A0A0F9FIB6_9ZZZZ
MLTKEELIFLREGAEKNRDLEEMLETYEFYGCFADCILS